MIEDKLTHDERVRLECIAQANIAAGGPLGRSAPAQLIVNIAAAFEKFVTHGNGTERDR